MSAYKIISKLLLMTCLGLYAVAGSALALSEAELKSYLNQPLDVRIGLLTEDMSELDGLQIALSQLGQNNHTTRYQLIYEILKSDKGNFLKITSSDLIREPVIAFTLDIGWSDGHVVREYSFLIDPPRN